MSKETSLKGSDRWVQAQSYEVNWWRNVAVQFDTNYLQKLAHDIPEKISKFRQIDKNDSVIEIGAGPIGIVSFLQTSVKTASDPLNDEFDKIDQYRKLRSQMKNNGTTYVTAKGEHLPFEDHSYDIYISDNVLDHVEKPDAIMREAKRVLKNDGILYVRLNVYNYWGWLVRLVMELFRIDKGHPHTFTSHKIKQLMTQSDLEIISSNKSSYVEGWKRDVIRAKNGNLKALIQTIFAITRIHFEIIAKPVT